MNNAGRDGIIAVGSFNIEPHNGSCITTDGILRCTEEYIINDVPNKLVMPLSSSFRKRLWRVAMLILRGWCYLD